MKMPSTAARIRRLSARAMLLAGLIAALPSPGWARAPSCPHSISACGCVIRRAGLYTVTGPLSSSSMTENCIAVAASSVELDLGGNSITGPLTPGSPPPTVDIAGIFVRGTAKKFVLTATSGATISQFAAGIVVRSRSAVLSGFQATGNEVGVSLDGASHCDLSAFDASGNIGDGVYLWDALRNHMVGFSANNNGGDGVDVSSRSTHNEFVSFTADQNASAGIELTRFACSGRVGGPLCQHPPVGARRNKVKAGETDGNAFGILIDGSHADEIDGNTAASNSQSDLFDANRSCDHNRWAL